ncbi:MAG: CPBP family intramembrane metalloprotease, partial [candidate division Zixibacteria bacterium]|nr:CPBP family intramembrane metalloprotease [candidate division Zixibacteria bacterium]
MLTVKSEQLFTQASPTSVAGKILQFPLVRILAASLSLVPATLLRPGYKYLIAPSLSESVEVMVGHAERVLGIVLFIVFYRLYTRIVERREAHEMGSKGALKEFGQGVLIGGGILCTIVLIMAIAGYYSIAGFTSDWTVALHTIIPFGIAAFAEELLFRIIFFKLTEELAGSWVALILQAAFFGFAHIGNPNASVWAAVAIALEASILLAAAFMYTRRIWLVFG